METKDRTGKDLQTTVNKFLDQVAGHKKQGATGEEIDKAFAKKAREERKKEILEAKQAISNFLEAMIKAMNAGITNTEITKFFEEEGYTNMNEF